MVLKQHAIALATLPEVFEHGGYFVRTEFVRQEPALGWGLGLQFVGQPLVLDIEFISKFVDKALADPAEGSDVVRENAKFHLEPCSLVVINKLFK